MTRHDGCCSSAPRRSRRWNGGVTRVAVVAALGVAALLPAAHLGSVWRGTTRGVLDGVSPQLVSATIPPTIALGPKRPSSAGFSSTPPSAGTAAAPAVGTWSAPAAIPRASSAPPVPVMPVTAVGTAPATRNPTNNSAPATTPTSTTAAASTTNTAAASTSAACAVALAYLQAHAKAGFAHYCRPGRLAVGVPNAVAYTCVPGARFSCPDGSPEIIIADPACAVSYENEASNSYWNFAGGGLVAPGVVQNGRTWDPYGQCT